MHIYVPIPTLGDYGLFEKMFGATSNNDARLAAKSYGRALTIDKYDPKKVRVTFEPLAFKCCACSCVPCG